MHRWGQIDRGTHTHTHTHMCIPLKLTIILCWRHCWTPEVAEAIRASAQNGCKMKNPTNNACARAVIHLRIYTHWSHTCACPSTRAGRSSSQWLRNQQVFSHMISHMHVLTLSLTHTHTHTHTHTYTHTHTRTHTHTHTQQDLIRDPTSMIAHYLEKSSISCSPRLAALECMKVHSLKVCTFSHSVHILLSVHIIS